MLTQEQEDRIRREEAARVRLRALVKTGKPATEAIKWDNGFSEDISVRAPEITVTDQRDGKVVGFIRRPERIPASDEETLLQGLAVVGAEIEAKLDDELQRVENEKGGPSLHPDWNWASYLGHPCRRHLVYMRLNGADEQPMDMDSLWRFKEGREIEAKIKRELSVIGYEVTKNQQRLRDEKHKISGRIDGDVPIKRKLPAPFAGLDEAPGEIKSVNPRFWDELRTIEDVKRSRHWWIRKHVSQLNLYLFMHDKPGGFLILGTFGKRPRFLPMALDRDMVERDLGMAEAVNAHVAAGTYPEPMPYDPSVCGMCGWNHLCQPLKATEFREIKEAEVPEIEHFLDLRKFYEAYIHEKAKLIGTGEKPGRYHGVNAITGNIEISTTVQQRKAYDVPDEVKAPYVRENKVIITTIERREP